MLICHTESSFLSPRLLAAETTVVLLLVLPMPSNAVRGFFVNGTATVSIISHEKNTQRTRFAIFTTSNLLLYCTPCPSANLLPLSQASNRCGKETTRCGERLARPLLHYIENKCN